MDKKQSMTTLTIDHICRLDAILQLVLDQVACAFTIISSYYYLLLAPVQTGDTGSAPFKWCRLSSKMAVAIRCSCLAYRDVGCSWDS